MLATKFFLLSSRKYTRLKVKEHRHGLLQRKSFFSKKFSTLSSLQFLSSFKIKLIIYFLLLYSFYNEEKKQKFEIILLFLPFISMSNPSMTSSSFSFLCVNKIITIFLYISRIVI